MHFSNQGNRKSCNLSQTLKNNFFFFATKITTEIKTSFSENEPTKLRHTTDGQSPFQHIKIVENVATYYLAYILWFAINTPKVSLVEIIVYITT